MKVDIGFWNQQGKYIPDIQEVSEVEMDKEIIIDGVNVAGCEFLRHCVIPDNEGCKIDDSLCCDVGNCSYKQLKRLEQENAELKEKIKKYAAINEQETKDYAELKAKNERLKKECTLYDCGNKEWAIEYKKLEDDYTELIDRLDDITYDKTNYYQTLQEIKVISEEFIKNVSEDCINTTPMYLVHKEILQKISEVE